MNFTEITKEELKQHQEKNSHRHFFSQCAFYKELADYNNLKTIILAVKENDEILAYGIFNYYQYKKFFYKVTSQFGPIMDYNNEELTNFFFTNLKNYFKKDLKVLAVRLSPFVNEKLFKDIEEIEENSIAKNVHKQLSNLGYNSMNKDLFDDPTLATRCVFSKELTDLTKDNLLKNISNKARSSINKTKTDNIKIRDLDLNNKDDFETFKYLNEITVNRLNVELQSANYFLNLQKHIGDKLHIKLAYIEFEKFIDDNQLKLNKSYSEKNNLIASLEDPNTNQKRTKNKISELEKNIISIEKKVDKLKNTDKRNNIIPLSCSVFIESGEDLVYFLGMTDKDLNVFEGPYAIIYCMMQYAIDNNFKYFNFYGNSQDFSKSAVDYNILQFKRSFNGNIEWFMDNYELRNNIGKIWKI